MYSPRTEFIKNIFETKGHEQYGEGVSQWEHAVQAATFAKEKNAPVEIIVAAFLHDIGHLIDDNERMEDLGNLYHEKLGAFYLEKLGFPKQIQLLVQNHVAAKRYLSAVDKSYLMQLSSASLKTLSHQGGPMSKKEIEDFENDPMFDAFVQLRHLDDEAKIENYPTGNARWIWEILDGIA